MNNNFKERLHFIKSKYTDKQLKDINQKNLNHFLRKKYRYEKLNMQEKVEECNAYISLYQGCFLDFIDYSNKKRKRKFEQLAYLLLLIKEQKESLIKNDNENLLLELQNKNLFDLTEEEANLLGGKILREYKRCQFILCNYLSKYIDSAEIITCETLRDLTNICGKYLKKRNS